MDLVNYNAIDEAKELYDYLCNIQGKGIITGQHTLTREMEELAYIKEVTGKQPALCGFELLSYSPNINYKDADEECLNEIERNKGTMKQAMEWVENTGGILTFTWHWYSPLGGRDKSFYSKNTDFNPEKVLQCGTAEREAFYRDMSIMAELLKTFLDKRIPILWRPFHESDGEWFWWGSRGVEVARALYLLMFDYFVNEKKLDNLIWVWNAVKKEGYPGDEYVDIISRDLYVGAGVKTDYQKEYEELVQITAADKPVALAEIGTLPDMELLGETKVPWIYYMTWSGGFVLTDEVNSRKDLQKVYGHPYSIKLNN